MLQPWSLVYILQQKEKALIPTKLADSTTHVYGVYEHELSDLTQLKTC